MTVSRVSLGDVSFNQTYHTHNLGDNNQKGSRDHHGHHTFICSKYFMFPRLSAEIHSCTMFNDSGQSYPKWDFPRCLRNPVRKVFPIQSPLWDLQIAIWKVWEYNAVTTLLGMRWLGHPCRNGDGGISATGLQRLLLCPGPVKNGRLQQWVVVNVEVVRKIRWYWWRVHIVK